MGGHLVGKMYGAQVRHWWWAKSVIGGGMGCMQTLCVHACPQRAIVCGGGNLLGHRSRKTIVPN